jgi:glycosyltransferase involved in cell wall biosynthesis
MEWIVVDDGTDSVADLFEGVDRVRYIREETKMPLGKKRNLMHTHAKGEYIVYMDDDDYYPPERVEHAVRTLMNNPTAMCAGSSEIYIWFKHIYQMWQFGPYGPNHATAGTFAFRRELLKSSRYEDDAALAEEKAFLKDYTVPFVQLDPLKTILVFSHEHNTFDKRKLLDRTDPRFAKASDKTVDLFIKEVGLKKFFMEDIEKELANYEPGRPQMKPDVLTQIIAIEERRRKEAEAMADRMRGQIAIRGPDGSSRPLDIQQTAQLLQAQQVDLQRLRQREIALRVENDILRRIIYEIRERNGELDDEPSGGKIREVKSTTPLSMTGLLAQVNRIN